MKQKQSTTERCSNAAGSWNRTGCYHDAFYITSMADTKGGWESESTVKYFAGYCAYVAEKLGDLMHYVITINEANMGLQVAAIAERYKRQMMAKRREGKRIKR